MSILSTMGESLKKAPSSVWILVLVGGLIAFIGAIIVSFFLLANVEGVASVVLLIAGWLIAGALVHDNLKLPGAQFWKGGIITFYALMGMAIDQPGNYLLNKPIEFFCPTQTHLARGITVLHPLPGRTDIIQDFTCVNAEGKIVHRPSMGTLIGVRFFEYVIIAYVLIEIRKLLNKRRTTPANLPKV